MTKEQYLLRENLRLAKEIEKIHRHSEFIAMAQAHACETEKIDWDCFWTWYYNSDCTFEQAYIYSKEDE